MVVKLGVKVNDRCWFSDRYIDNRLVEVAYYLPFRFEKASANSDVSIRVPGCYLRSLPTRFLSSWDPRGPSDVFSRVFPCHSTAASGETEPRTNRYRRVVPCGPASSRAFVCLLSSASQFQRTLVAWLSCATPATPAFPFVSLFLVRAVLS